MKRLLACVSLVALSATAAVAAPTPAPKAPQVAPADEYFGKLKMSILGIRNTLRDLGFKADADPTHSTSIMGALAFAEDATHDWEHKYPHDTWLPRTLFALERCYAKVDSDDARAKAKATMVWLVHDFPKNPFAVTGKKELAQNLVGVKPSPPPETVSSGDVGNGDANGVANGAANGGAPATPAGH